jgi:hypothetical protein
MTPNKALQCSDLRFSRPFVAKSICAHLRKSAATLKGSPRQPKCSIFGLFNFAGFRHAPQHGMNGRQ